MARFKLIEHKSDGIEEIVNPIAPYARKLRDQALVIDTETTGSSAEDEVIELAIVRASDGTVLFDEQFKASKPIEYFAQRVHGIRDIDLRNKPRIGDFWDRLNEILDGATVGAWNSPYDSRMLGQTFRKYALPEPGAEWVCLMALYRQFKGLPKNCKLEDACQAMGVRRGSHRAVTDALAAARVLYKIAKATPEDEVITYDHAKTGDFDETTMPAGHFLAEFGWKEKKHLVTRAGEDEFVESDWMDPDTGEIYPFLDALDCQRERMMKRQQPNNGGVD
jgi:DNA polymerase-3 subunit epsilon